MTGPERLLLLLCAELGDGCRPLSGLRVRELNAMVLSAGGAGLEDLPREEAGLRRLGLDREAAARTAELLCRDDALDRYLALGAELGIRPLTARSAGYPRRLRRLAADAPPVLFYRGDLSVLEMPSVSLVGRRALSEAGAAFAARVGRLAAEEGLLLVSGDARGADCTAEDACLRAGGRVAAFLPGGLRDRAPRCARELLLCARGWHLEFRPFLALERNGFIHALGEKTLAAESDRSGGTFGGCADNLRRGLSPLWVHDDGSPGSRALQALGAAPLPLSELTTLRGLQPPAADLPLPIAPDAPEL